MNITWVLEKVVFEDRQSRLAAALESAGHEVIWWKDSWLEEGLAPSLSDSFVVFQGSLGCASNVKELGWSPGAYCNTEAFHCTAWYKATSSWLVHEQWKSSSVKDLVEHPESALDSLSIGDKFFVRPDSPLKPFSGRVLERSKLSLKALDHGFYYDDENLPIIVAPVQQIHEEWRLVVANGRVVASSGYEASGRKENEPGAPQRVVEYGINIAESIQAPDPIYVMDICEINSGLKLMELNPFSGADLYNCDRSKIVEAVEQIATDQKSI